MSSHEEDARDKVLKAAFALLPHLVRMNRAILEGVQQTMPILAAYQEREQKLAAAEERADRLQLNAEVLEAHITTLKENTICLDCQRRREDWR
jgi:hypothetical protein